MDPNSLVYDNLRNVENIESDPKFQELVASIRFAGVQEPITYWQKDGKNIIQDGHRRVHAAKIAGRDNVPVRRVAKPSEQERIQRQMIANMHREPFNPMDLALAIGQLQNKHGLSGQEIAAIFGKSESWVSQIVGLLELIPKLRAAVRSGKLGYKAAYEASRVPKQDQETYAPQIEAARTVRAVQKVRRDLRKIERQKQPRQMVAIVSDEIKIEEQPDEQLQRVLRMIDMARDFVRKAKSLAVELEISIEEHLDALKKEI